MQRINHATAPNNRWVAKDPNVEGSGTVIAKDWLQGLDDEFINLIEKAGLTPSGTDLEQIYKAVSFLIEKKATAEALELLFAMSVTPNFLADTYQFSSLCGGAVNTAMSAQDAHANSIWGAYFSYNGSVVNTTMTVITLEKLKDYGLYPKAGDDFVLASPDFDSQTYPFYGSSFRVVLFDINAVSGGGGAGYLHQGCYQQTRWGAKTKSVYASALVNVLECSPNLQYDIHGNLCEGAVVIGASDVGKGWQYKHGTRKMFGGCHQPWTRGTNMGRIKFALALPYIGFGDHGNHFVWADALAKPSQIKAGTHCNYRYSHWMGN